MSPLESEEPDPGGGSAVGSLGTVSGPEVVPPKRQIESTSQVPTLLRTWHFPGQPRVGKPMIVGRGRCVVVGGSVGRTSGGEVVVCRYFGGGRGGKVGMIPWRNPQATSNTHLQFTSQMSLLRNTEAGFLAPGVPEAPQVSPNPERNRSS